MDGDNERYLASFPIPEQKFDKIWDSITTEKGYHENVKDAGRKFLDYMERANLPEKITDIVKESMQKNLDVLTRQNEEKSERLNQHKEKTENTLLSGATTADLLDELKNRDDVLFVAAYTKDTIKDRLKDIGWDELAKNDEFVNDCFDAVDKEDLRERFEDWENEEYSAYDALTDIVNEKVMDEDEKNLQDDIIKSEAEKCFDILETNTPWSVNNRNPEPQTYGDVTRLVYEIETQTSFGQDVIENITVNVNDIRDNLEQFPDRNDHFAEAFSDGLKEVYDEFDPSEEASNWLDETGHGKNGAPYAMKDVLKDMEEAQEMIGDAYRTLDRIYSEHEKNKEKEVSPESIGKEFLEKYGEKKKDKKTAALIRPYGLMELAHKAVTSFESGNEEKRKAALHEYLSKLGVLHTSFVYRYNDVDVKEEEIKRTEKVVDEAFKAMVAEKKKTVSRIKESAVEATPRFEEQQKKEKEKQKQQNKNSGKEMER